VNTNSNAVQGFAQPANVDFIGQPTPMENWAFAAPLDSHFMQIWRSHFRDALHTGADKWVSEQPPALVGSLSGYLAEHVAWVLTRTELSNFTYPSVVLPSTDVGRPFYYLLGDDWVSCWSVFHSMTATYPVPFTDFYKYRGAERDCVSPLWMYSAFWFWPFAPWGSKNVAAWLREQLEAEPDLLAASYSELQWVNVGFFLIQWWGPLLILLLIFISLVWCVCYRFSERCRGCTQRCGTSMRQRGEGARQQCARCIRSPEKIGEMEGLTQKADPSPPKGDVPCIPCLGP